MSQKGKRFERKYDVCQIRVTEERIYFGHTAIKPKSVERCSDVCPSVNCSYLLSLISHMIIELN